MVNHMNKQMLIDRALALGFDTVEVYTQNSTQESLNVFQNNVDNFTISQSGGIAVRGIYHGKLGQCFLEEDSDDNIEFVIQQMIHNANAITSTDKVEIYAGSESYPVIEESESDIDSITANQKIEFLKDMEQRLLNADERIVQVMDCVMDISEAEVMIQNSLGLDIKRKEKVCVFVASVLANEDNDSKSAYEYAFIRNFSQFDKEAYVQKLVSKAVSKLNALQVASGKYPVILKNEVMSDVLGALSSLFNGENAYKGISLLMDKVDSQIFDSKITIVDDPLLKDGYSSTPFDSEGVASFKKVVVEKGVLKTYLHNLKSAAMMNTHSTGNGFKSGYASGVSIQPTNFYIEAGNESYEEMIQSMKKGIIIDDVSGLHAGLNPITTDFSLQASGYVVEDGKIIRPINLITVAGNFVSMMNQVDTVGSDLYFSSSGIGSPSLLIHELTISGE